MPPGARCDVRGGVLVSTVMPRHRIGLGLVAQRDRVAGRAVVALRVVGAVVLDGEEVDRGDAAVLAEADLDAASACPARARPM